MSPRVLRQERVHGERGHFLQTLGSPPCSSSPGLAASPTHDASSTFNVPARTGPPGSRHGFAAAQKLQPRERGAASEAPLLRNRKRPSGPSPRHVHRGPVLQAGLGVGGTQGGGGQASFTARQDLLISRTNSDVFGLEHICKVEWKHL